MELNQLRHLADELKVLPYLNSDVTHVFTLKEKQLLSLKYSSDLACFQVTLIGKDKVYDFAQSDQAAEAIKRELGEYTDPSLFKS